MQTISMLQKLLHLACYGLIVSIIPISKANHTLTDHSTDKIYPSWVDVLRSQKGQPPEKRIADNIAQHGSSWGKWVTFPNKILAIALKVGPWEKPETLFSSQDFVAMYKYPAYYWKHAIAYLANPIYPEKYKQIAIYGLENLDYTHYLSFAEACYKLYQEGCLSESLFRMVLSFDFLHIHPLVMGITMKGHYKDADMKTFLEKVQSGKKYTPIGFLITEMLSGRLGNAWANREKSAYLHYRDPFPFADVIHEAYKDYKEEITGNMNLKSPDQPSYFLMIYDHPNYHYDSRYSSLNHSPSFRYIPHDDCNHSSCHCSLSVHNHYDRSSDLALFLKSPHYTIMEKRFAVVAMQQLYQAPLEIGSYRDGSDTYFSMMQAIGTLYEAYPGDAYWDPLLVHLIEDVMRANQSVFSVFHSHPFAILDYKISSAEDALKRFMYEPTIPCGIRNIAKKMRNGSLATPQELDRVENEAKLYTTHFRLYETIPQSK